MKRIKILKNGVFLDIVRQTMSIKYENNALSTEFKGNYSSYPFLILENANTKTALGPADITSINKKKTVDVSVLFAGDKYFGKLQVLSFLPGFRKCNLKFSSRIIEITSTKVSKFMPVVSVIPGETNPVPYTEEIEDYIPGAENWETYPVPFISQGWPDVKWQFPSYNYGPTNVFSALLDEFILNDTIIVSGDTFAQNRNHPHPHVYLLAPIFYALQTIGYKMMGSFPDHPFIQRLLLHNAKDNTSETLAQAYLGDIDWNTVSWEPNGDIELSEKKTVTFLISYEGTYKIHIELNEVPPYVINGSSATGFLFIDVGTVFYTAFDPIIQEPDEYTRIIDFEFEAEASMVGQYITFTWISSVHRVPEHLITINFKKEAILHFMHPTIELGRYVPDWLFGDYINQLKNLFNLKVSVDDVLQRMYIDFNEDVTVNELVEIVKSSHFISEYDNSANEEFVFRYENDTDDFVSVSKQSGTLVNEVINTDFSKEYKTKFKHILVSESLGPMLSEEEEEKAGTGLLIYDPVNKPFPQPSYNGITLKLSGDDGLVRTFWKNWTKARLNGSGTKIEGYFTETELKSMIKKSAVYIDNQLFRIVTMNYTETPQLNYKISAEIESWIY